MVSAGSAVESTVSKKRRRFSRQWTGAAGAEMLSVRADHAVDDPYVIAIVPIRTGFAEHAAGAAFEAHGDFITLACTHPLLDGIACECATHGAGHGGEVIAAAATDLVAQNAADYRTADTADAAALAGLADFARRFDDAAFCANRAGRGAAGITRRSRISSARCALHGCRDRGGTAAGASRRRRNPAHDGGDAGRAEQDDCDTCDPQHGMRGFAVLGLHWFFFRLVRLLTAHRLCVLSKFVNQGCAGEPARSVR